MSIDATAWAWKQRVKGNDKLILLSLADRANETNRAWPSLHRLAFDTCLNIKTIKDGIKRLEAQGLITIHKEQKGDGRFSNNIYSLVGVDNREHQKAVEDTTKARKRATDHSPKTGHQKRATNLKENNQHITAPLSNSKINPLAWKDFVEHRKNKKVELTELAVEKAVKQLEKLSFEEQSSCVDLSIVNNWTGLFPDRVKNKRGTHREAGRQSADIQNQSTDW